MVGFLALPYSVSDLSKLEGDVCAGSGVAGNVAVCAMARARSVGHVVVVGGMWQAGLVADGSGAAGIFAGPLIERNGFTSVGPPSQFNVIPAALRSRDNMRHEKSMKVALMPWWSAAAGPVFAAGVVSAGGAGNVGEVVIVA